MSLTYLKLSISFTLCLELNPRFYILALLSYFLTLILSALATLGDLGVPQLFLLPGMLFLQNPVWLGLSHH